MPRPLRIAHVSPPLEPVPPPAYGGTERIVAELVRELVARGHDVTTFASGDSDVPGRLVPTVPAALWAAGFTGDPAPWFLATIDRVVGRASDFDVIHSHLEWYSPVLSRATATPVVATFHGRLDQPWAADLLRGSRGRHVAISHAQAQTQHGTPWAAVIHNGLDLRDAPAPGAAARGDDLVFVGRITPEKGVVDAIEIAQRTGRRLRIAAKSGKTQVERDYLAEVFRPALARAGSAVEFLGELTNPDRDRLFVESWATLMPGDWPEPFGLVAIEALACGTPVIARPTGALPEIVRDGVDGFFGDDVRAMAFRVDRVADLDRQAIRDSVIERFSVERMTDGYEAIYRERIAAGAWESSRSPQPEPASVDAAEPARPAEPAGSAEPATASA
jgi:glycosyltransferase involved in cell wall biosynthesis